MPRETKSNGQKDILDRFYTKEETVKKCLSELKLNEYDCIIEPSAGSGSFLNEFLKENIDVYAFDIFPQHDNINQEDWFKVDKNKFKNYNNILVCGNPPFGQQNSLAINFFNESAKFCNTIAFILPLSFKKDSVQNRLDLSFHLEKEILLDNCAFSLKNENDIIVPCVFQVWKKKEFLRKPIRLKTTSNLFSFTTKDFADFRIQRVGGNAGKAFFDLDKSANSNYFIKNNSEITNEDFINYINNLTFPTIEFTVGPKSLSKGELIAIVEENWN